jgi:hypothetical protein
MTRRPIRALTIGVAEPHPVPPAALDGASGKRRGDLTNFSSPHLVNTRI